MTVDRSGIVFAAQVATRTGVEVELVVGFVEDQRMGYVLRRAAHKAGHFSENGALLVEAIRIPVFKAVDRIVVSDEECPSVEGDAVGPVKIIGGLVHGVGATIAVFVGQGQYRALATGGRAPLIPSASLHVGHVQDALVVPSHKAGFIYLVGEEFDLKAGREVERAVGEPFNWRWFEVEVDFGR